MEELQQRVATLEKQVTDLMKTVEVQKEAIQRLTAATSPREVGKTAMKEMTRMMGG